MKKNSNKNPFRTPKNYFDSFEERLMDKLDKEKSSIPKKDGLKVPEGYFDTLQSKLSKKLDETYAEPKLIKLRPYKKYFAMAAAIAVIAVLTIGLNWNTSEEITFGDLANSDIEAYFENSEFELSTYEIAEVLSIEDIEISDILENRLDEDHVIDYLNDTVDDFEELNLDYDE